MLAPTRMSVTRPTGTTMARLAITTSLPMMVLTIRVLEILIPLRGCILVVVEVARRGPLSRALDVSHTRLFLPDVRLVWICIDVGDDRSGGASGRVGAVSCVGFSRIGKRSVGAVGFRGICDLWMLCG